MLTISLISKYFPAKSGFGYILKSMIHVKNNNIPHLVINVLVPRQQPGIQIIYIRIGHLDFEGPGRPRTQEKKPHRKLTSKKSILT